jgi:very-short-patch-repair endonuclease
MPSESVYDLRIRGLRQIREQGWSEEEIAALAHRQYGVVARWQLMDIGLGKGVIERRLASRRLHQVHPGVYAVGHRRIPKEGWWMVAVLSSGPAAVLSHHSAAALWGLRGYSGGTSHVTAAHKSTSSRKIRRHVSHLPEDERTVEEGIPVTTVPRTILDLAATASADTIENLLRESERLQLSDRLSLPDLIARYRGKRGTRKVQLALDRLKEDPAGTKRSPLEERFAPFLRLHRLPLSRFNDWIVLGDKRYRVDCHWPELRQIVELDGWDGHSTRSAFREDRARDRRLLAAGYSVAHITWNQLDDEAAEIAADLRRLLISRPN